MKCGLMRAQANSIETSEVSETLIVGAFSTKEIQSFKVYFVSA